MTDVLVDSCIWSMTLRRKSPIDPFVSDQLADLIYAEKVKMIGPIRQEVLSGISNPDTYGNLQQKLKYFPNIEILDVDYVCAAEFSNQCRRKGIQGSHIDFLICAVAYRLKMSIFTCDKDFTLFSKYIPIILHSES